MRVLVEQTESEVRSVLQRLGVLWDGGEGTHDGKVGVHLLMGGANAGRWHLYPECDAVLIGTQDMLLSRALNHGYASPRGRWPMEFGLLNHDALWVMDEVQLMGVGLATSGQLQVFRDEDQAAGKLLRPCFTWWMSATLQRAWLEKSPETTRLVEQLDQNTHRIQPIDRTGDLWDVSKPLERKPFDKPKALAHEISQCHRASGCGKDGPTLVVLNTVKLAVEVWKALGRDRDLKQADTDIRLVHSRFRPHERRTWRETFLNRGACGAETNRIIVATQVVEAGVDISASLLVTELAPWPSLVQRFGRCARWGGTGQVLIADFQHDTDKKAAPYAVDELNAARDACDALQDVGPTHLERFEEEHQTLLPRLYPYEPQHLLLRHEVDELFDTSPDLSGADIDISRFIRSGEERDVQVFWAEVGKGSRPPASLKPTRDELCSVPFLHAREWLRPYPAWVWDWLSREWRQAKSSDIYPGQTVLIAPETGGYSCESGWDPGSSASVQPVHLASEGCFENKPCWTRDGNGWAPSKRQVRTLLPKEDHADAAEEDESLSVINNWQTIASHGLQVGREVERIAGQVMHKQAKLLRLLHLAGRWHDLGKAHPAFQGSIKADDRPEGNDIAKAPDHSWPCSSRNLYRSDSGDQRRGFRHELASTLGLFGVLQRHEPQHPALLDPWSASLFKAMGKHEVVENLDNSTDLTRPTELEREILDLDADNFDLLAYLVCAHHGKVRMAWNASPADQEADDRQLRIRGIRQGDKLPSVLLAAADGEVYPLPATALDLSPSETGLSPRTGRSWVERVLNLLICHGPFTLAWLETLLRAADQRASMQAIGDTLLQERKEGNAGHHLDEGHRTMAQPAAGRAASPALGGDPPPCGQLHGHGGRAGGRGMDSETTRPPDSGTTHPPASATRYVETRGAILKYQDLVPLLGERVADTELSIYDREFAALPLHDLLLQLHRCICVDLIPEIAGCWRRQDVCVGDHEPPPHWEVPMLMRSYAADMEARLADLIRSPEQQKAITDLTFAEGRLLHIHPFKDFNGRVSRLFLIELLCRLDLSVIASSIASPVSEEASHYFAALRAYDRHDPHPLTAVWRRRFALEAG